MKVGILVETGRDGLEATVVPRICQLLQLEYEVQFEVEIVPMDNKARLLEECGTVASALLKAGCDRVVVLWDERPAWPQKDGTLCWHSDRVKAIGELQNAGVLDNTYLVCIEREFESWLLADHLMIGRVLSRPTYTPEIPKQKRTEQNKNPKGTMTSLFNQYGGKTYVDVQFAKQFAQELTSLNKIKKCKTLKRFALKVAGVQL